MRVKGQLIITTFMVLAGALQLMPGQSAAAVTAAFLRSERLAADAAGAMIEAELLSVPQVRWVEREKIDAALRERSLQESLTGDELAARRRLGKLLQADLLLILRPATGAATDAGELIVCETRQGLRVAREPISLAATSAELTARRAAALARRAVERAAQPRLDLVAVYPFTSRNLTHDHDGLKEAYARLIEQGLAEQPGVWLVELQEARAIATEIATAQSDGIARRLPLFVEGEFSHKDYSPTAPVTVQITIKRGQGTLKQWKLEELPADQATQQLRQTTLQELARVIGIEPARQDARQEAEELARRADIAYRLGFWLEALQLAEASLLLNDDQPELHRDALLAGINHHRVAGPLSEQQRTEQIPFLRRLVAHKEAYLSRRAIHMGDKDFGIGVALVGIEALRRESCEAYVRLMRLRYEKGWQDGLYQYFTHHYQEAPPEVMDEIINFKLRVADYWQPHMGGEDRLIWDLAFRWRNTDSAEMQAVIKRLEGSANPTAQAAAREMQRRLALGLTIDQDPDAKQWVPPTTQPRKFVARATIEKFSLGIGRLAGWAYAGQGIDLIWTYSYSDEPGKLYLMRAPGKVKHVIDILADSTRNSVCYDGRYIWAASAGQRAGIIVADPLTGKAVVHHPGNLPPTKISKFSVVPLAPGRVAAVGRFGSRDDGRTWAALFEHGPSGVTCKVVHEAPQIPEQGSRPDWSQPGWSFSCRHAYTLSPPGLTPNATPVAIFDRDQIPAVIDPALQSFSLLRAWPPEGVKIRALFPGQVHEGAWYCTVMANNSWPTDKILKVSLPGPKVEVVNEAAGTRSYLFFHEGLPYLYSRLPSLHRASSVDQQFEPLELVWPKEEFFIQSPHFVSSQHHGLVIYDIVYTGTIRFSEPAAAVPEKPSAPAHQRQ
jgi:hypothetical protein